jgi:hypothetical protein
MEQTSMQRAQSVMFVGQLPLEVCFLFGVCWELIVWLIVEKRAIMRVKEFENWEKTLFAIFYVVCGVRESYGREGTFLSLM